MGREAIQQHAHRKHRTPTEKSSGSSQNSGRSPPVVPAKKNSGKRKAESKESGQALIEGTAHRREDRPNSGCRPYQGKRNSVQREFPQPEKKDKAPEKTHQQAKNIGPSRVWIEAGQNRVSHRWDAGYQKH